MNNLDLNLEVFYDVQKRYLNLDILSLFFKVEKNVFEDFCLVVDDNSLSLFVHSYNETYRCPAISFKLLSIICNYVDLNWKYHVEIIKFNNLEYFIKEGKEYNPFGPTWVLELI